MKRQIIHIDQEKCNGCGACAAACHEGAITMIGGKATLMRDDYCDGMGDCLPHCPTGAITFEQREAAPYNEAAVQAARQHKAAQMSGCPGSAPKAMHVCPGSMAKALHPDAPAEELDAAFQENTRAVFAESLSNPSLVVLDIEKFAQAAHSHGVPLIVPVDANAPHTARQTDL